MMIKETPLQSMRTGSIDTVSIREVPGLSWLDLRVAPGTATQAAVAAALDSRLPAKPGSVTISQLENIHALCLAPDWWLITGLQEADQKLASLPSGEEHHFSAVDVSDQRTTVELQGPYVKELLAHLWEQDLREQNFPVGAVSQGLMVKAPVIVYHLAPLCYRILVRSSFALHVWKALVDAAVEWV